MDVQALVEENYKLRRRIEELDLALAEAEGRAHSTRVSLHDEPRLRAFGSAPSGGQDTDVQSDMLEWAMGHQHPTAPASERWARPSPAKLTCEIASLRDELVRVRGERDALALELEALRPPRQSPGMLTRPTSATSRFSAYAGTSTISHNMSYHSAASNWSGLRAVSKTSLESIAAWVFAMNPQGIQPNKAYERINVPEGDPRRGWLEDHLLSSLQPHRRAYNSEEWCPVAEIRIMNVQEVVNVVAATAYERELEQIRATRDGERARIPELEHAIYVRTEFGAPRLNEVLLFHGCKWQSLFAILREGFDSRLGGINTGAAFGIGSYFTTVASKADLYTERWSDWERRPPIEVPPHLRCMVISRVALGEVMELRSADASLRRPPLAPDGFRYDSVMGVPAERGGCVDYDEFVIYKPSQAMPQFVVEYEHLESCQCRTCVMR